jgi:putative phage-type endonuclease
MIQQGTDEWFNQRLGKVTASQIANVLMKPSMAGFQNYAAQLVCEQLTGVRAETYKSSAMEHGNETEPQARAMYELNSDVTVEEVAFINHPTIEMAGASPDGLVGKDGLVEIKCPQPNKHLKNIMGGKIDRNYMLQMQWQMRCTGSVWCDFISFNPAFPDELQMKQTRVSYDKELVEGEIEPAVIAFLAHVEETKQTLLGKI